MKKLKEIHDAVVNEASEERYVVQLEFYIWAKDAKDAKRQADAIAKQRRAQFDDQAEVTELRPMPFGRMR